MINFLSLFIFLHLRLYSSHFSAFLFPKNSLNATLFFRIISFASSLHHSLLLHIPAFFRTLLPHTSFEHLNTTPLNLPHSSSSIVPSSLYLTLSHSHLNLSL